MTTAWWSEFYRGAALELWRRAFTLDENRGQARDVARLLDLRHGERVLDVPCGNGRLGLELARLGFRVSGLDACEEFVCEGRRAAAERELELDLHVGDMRTLRWAEEFDAVLCVGNSFGYFDEDDERAFLDGIARALRRKGRFLLEYPLVAELVRANPMQRSWICRGERLMLSESCYDPTTGRLATDCTFLDLTRPGGAPEARRASYRVYEAREVERLLGAAGFDAVELLGEPDGAPFGDASEQFWVRAVRA